MSEHKEMTTSAGDTLQAATETTDAIKLKPAGGIDGSPSPGLPIAPPQSNGAASGDGQSIVDGSTPGEERVAEVGATDHFNTSKASLSGSVAETVSPPPMKGNDNVVDTPSSRVEAEASLMELGATSLNTSSKASLSGPVAETVSPPPMKGNDNMVDTSSSRVEAEVPLITPAVPPSLRIAEAETSMSTPASTSDVALSKADEGDSEDMGMQIPRAEETSTATTALVPLTEAGNIADVDMTVPESVTTAAPPLTTESTAAQDAEPIVPDTAAVLTSDLERQTANAAQVDISLPDGTAMSTSPAEAVQNGGGEGIEWEVDSSPIQSSPSDTSSDLSDSSDDSDNSEDDDYPLLDPAEQARILMEGDGGSDDEGGRNGNKDGGGGPLRTKNEKPDEVVIKPNVQVTPDMVIDELGTVENLVENLALIKAKVSGEYRVLETGSVLCLEDRNVIGAVAETLGRVQQPYYSVRFPNSAAIGEAGITQGTKIYYVEQHSTYVFTQPLKGLKGSDASNLHDEEVGDDEIEFSDDEAEAEYKRRLKQDRRSRKEARFGTNGASMTGDFSARRGTNEMNYDTPMNYDDNGDPEDLYTPLFRPPNLHEMMTRGETSREDRTFHGRESRGRGWRGGRRGGDGGRGRGDRGRGSRTAHGDRGKDRRYRGASPSDMLNGTPRAATQNAAQQYGNGSIPTPTVPTPSFSPRQVQFAPDSQFPPPFPPSQSQFSPPPAHGTPQPPYQPYAQQPFPMSHHLQYQSTQAGFPLPPQYHPPHQQSPYPNPFPAPSTSTLPPGSFINPAFFRSQQTTQHFQYPSMPSQDPNYNMPHLPPLGQGYIHPQGQAQSDQDANAAFRAAQEKLDILRGLHGFGGGGAS